MSGNMESIFEKADFTAGSDHKERLRKVLFSDIKNDKGKDSAEKLRDEELDMAAGGKIENKSRIYVP